MKDDYRCEASVGIEPDLRIRLCGKPAKLYGWAALCDEHALPRLKAQGRALAGRRRP